MGSKKKRKKQSRSQRPKNRDQASNKHSKGGSSVPQKKQATVTTSRNGSKVNRGGGGGARHTQHAEPSWWEEAMGFFSYGSGGGYAQTSPNEVPDAARRMFGSAYYRVGTTLEENIERDRKVAEEKKEREAKG